MDIVWVRRDARLRDNAALHAAAAMGKNPVLVLFVFDERWVKGRHCHSSHCEFVAEGLEEMDSGLRARMQPSTGLLRCAGRTEDVLAALHSSDSGPIRRIWSHLVVGDAETRSTDEAVRAWCTASGVEWQQLDQYGLVLEGRINERGDSVFAKTFEKKMRESTLPIPTQITAVPWEQDAAGILKSLTRSSAASSNGGRSSCWIMSAPEVESAVPSCALVPQTCSEEGVDDAAWPNSPLRPGYDWTRLGAVGSLRPEAQHGGESHASQLLESFLGERGQHYAARLSAPNSAWESCSRLSPYLAWGQISLRVVLQLSLIHI